MENRLVRKKKKSVLFIETVHKVFNLYKGMLRNIEVG